MTKERKGFGLARARKHVVVHGFSNMVTFQQSGGKVSYPMISYSHVFLEAVGKRLPQGLGDSTPSALVVMEIPTGWVVQCMYVLEPKKLYHLWTADTKPEWLSSTIRKANGHPQVAVPVTDLDSAGYPHTAG